MSQSIHAPALAGWHDPETVSAVADGFATYPRPREDHCCLEAYLVASTAWAVATAVGADVGDAELADITRAAWLGAGLACDGKAHGTPPVAG